MRVSSPRCASILNSRSSGKRQVNREATLHRGRAQQGKRAPKIQIERENRAEAV